MKQGMALTVGVAFLTAMSMSSSELLAESTGLKEHPPAVVMPNKSMKGQGGSMLLAGQRIVIGIVEEAGADMAKVRTAEVQPLHLSVKQGLEKGVGSLKKGDPVVIIMNADNTVVDYHLAGQSGAHQIIKGTLAELADDVAWAVIVNAKGERHKYDVQGNIRSRLQQVQKGTSAVFLLGENNDIVDALAG